MSQIMKVPSNELFMRIQSNTQLTKNFKKDILNLYKRHPSVAMMSLEIIEEIEAKRLVPKGATLTDATSFYWDDKDAFSQAEELKDLYKTYANYMDVADNVIMFGFNYTWKKLPCNVVYYIIELEDGTFKTVVMNDKRE